MKLPKTYSNLLKGFRKLLGISIHQIRTVVSFEPFKIGMDSIEKCVNYKRKFKMVSISD